MRYGLVVLEVFEAGVVEVVEVEVVVAVVWD